jgi:hypothetical protein
MLAVGMCNVANIMVIPVDRRHRQIGRTIALPGTLRPAAKAAPPVARRFANDRPVAKSPMLADGFPQV